MAIITLKLAKISQFHLILGPKIDLPGHILVKWLNNQ